MDRYIFDFRKLITWLHESFTRKTKEVAWLYSSMKLLRDIHDQFIAFGNLKKDEIKYNGQTIKLERLLISKYGGGIFITNNQNTNIEPLIAYEANDPQNEHAYEANEPENVYAYEADAANLGDTNFTINVPAAISFDEDEMRATVNRYKLYGKTYDIQII